MTLSNEDAAAAAALLLPDRWAVETARLTLPRGNPPGPITFREHPFLLAVYRDLWPYQVWMKGAQVGFTTCAAVRCLWALTTWAMSVIYTLPTDGDATALSQERVGPLVDRSAYLKDRILDVDNVHTKRFGLVPRSQLGLRVTSSRAARMESMGAAGVSTLYFLGASTPSSAQMRDADMLVHDEEDRSDPEVIDQFQSRLSGPSAFRWRVRLSTPTIPSFGIDAAYQESDQRRWLIRCPGCAADFEMAFPDNVEPRTFAEHQALHEPVLPGQGCPDCHYACARCGRRLTDEERMVGRWDATAPGSGKAHGYYVSQMAAGYVPAVEMLRLREEHKYDQSFYNLVMGQPYETAGLQLTREALIERADPERPMISSSERPTYAGIDVHSTGDLDVVIDDVRGGVPTTVAIVRTRLWSDLYRIMREFRVATAVIDKGPEERLARSFADAHNQAGATPRVWRCQYLPETSNEKITWDRDQALVKAPRERVLSESAAELLQERRLPRYDRSPEWEAYLDHHKHAKRLPVWAPGAEGKEVVGYRWVRVGGDDDLFHSASYARLARLAPRDLAPPAVGVVAFRRGGRRPEPERVPAQIASIRERPPE